MVRVLLVFSSSGLPCVGRGLVFRHLFVWAAGGVDMDLLCGECLNGLCC